MAKEKETDDALTEKESTEETTESKIMAFACKLGQETNHNFSVYVYRSLKDEDNGRKKKPFIKKYVGVEPDPAEIAETYRGGTYLMQFIWYVNKKQMNKSYTLDVDVDAFPPLPKNSGAVIPFQAHPGMSEAMQMQLATISAITEVMKSAYAGGGGNGRTMVQQDPLEMFGGLMTTMEQSFSRAMEIQNMVHERVMKRTMESKFGLSDDGGAIGGGSTVETEPGIVSQYAPLVKDIVEGIKTVIGLFGEVPKGVVDKVKSDGRFKELLKDKKALVVVGRALSNEFGMDRATTIMRSFGVQMVQRQQPEIARTPEIPGATDPASVARRAVSEGGTYRPPSKLKEPAIKGRNGVIKSRESGK